MKYQVKAYCTIDQYCHAEYPSTTGLGVLKICKSDRECRGHALRFFVNEIVDVPIGEDPVDACFSHFTRKGLYLTVGMGIRIEIVRNQNAKVGLIDSRFAEWREGCLLHY